MRQSVRRLKSKGIVVDSDPFGHFITDGFLASGQADEILGVAELANGWSLRAIEDFYETYDLDLVRTPLPKAGAVLSDAGFVSRVHALMQDSFNVELDISKIDVVLQKMVAGQRIGVHTDYGPTKQTHRFLIQLNRGWSILNGGILMLFDEEFPTDTSIGHRYYLPSNGTAMGFEITPSSFHAVSKVIQGTRFTVAYSFRSLGT